MLIPFQARNGAAYSDPGSSLDLLGFSSGSIYWIYAVDKLNKPATEDRFGETLQYLLTKLLLQQVTFEHPDFVYSILPGNLPTNFYIKVFRACTGTLSGDGEAILQHQYAESEQLQWR